jgi:hypothetical protein
MSQNDAIGDAQLQLILNDAPSSKPLRTAYATEFAFFKAMSKYNIAQSLKSNIAQNQSESITIEESI